MYAKHVSTSVVVVAFIVLLVGLFAIIDLVTTPSVTHNDRMIAVTYLTTVEKPTPPHAFTHDGCSLFPDQLLGHNLRDACFTHDIRYWAGGTIHERQMADIALKDDIAHTGPLGPLFAVPVYVSVRLFGNSILTKTIGAEWGYGWN